MIETNNEHGFKVKVIADSNAYGTRITTLELVYPRFIHSEFMTHRMFSRNASSSRAIPVKRMLENCTAIPIHWGANKPGMQADEECTNNVSGVTGQGSVVEVPREEAWGWARFWATEQAAAFSDAGYHKQIVNRLTEPFQFIKVVVTATEWDNFFKLRDTPDAQPEIRELAQLMNRAMEQSEPKEFDSEDWHVPYYHQGFWQDTGNGLDLLGNDLQTAKTRSIAGCARVSYNNHDGSEPDPIRDTELTEFLLAEGHMSPFEHVGKPMPLRAVDWTDDFQIHFSEGVTHFDRKGGIWSGNFKNWIQLRQMGSLYAEDKSGDVDG